MRGLTFVELNNSISMFSLSAIWILDKQDTHSLSFKTKLVSVNSCPQNHFGSITLEIIKCCQLVGQSRTWQKWISDYFPAKCKIFEIRNNFDSGRIKTLSI